MQCEAMGFRRISFWPDRPDVLSTWTVRLEGDAAALPVLLSNGNMTAAGQLPGGRHYAVWEVRLLPAVHVLLTIEVLVGGTAVG